MDGAGLWAAPSRNHGHLEELHCNDAHIQDQKNSNFVNCQLTPICMHAIMIVQKPLVAFRHPAPDFEHPGCEPFACLVKNAGDLA
jgi:hypothetical protein